MGVEIALAASAALTYLQVQTQSSGADLSLKALDLKSKQNQLVAEQKSVDAYSRLNTYLEKSAVSASATGFSSGSASFGAMALAGQSLSAKEIANIETEKSIAEANIDVERANVRTKLKGDLLSDLAGFGTRALGIKAAFPKSGLWG